MEILTDIQKLDDLVQDKKRKYFFKHSTRCSVSAGAKKNLDEFLSKNERDIYQINVVENRDISNHLTELSSVQHESPQLLVFEDSEVKVHCSHWTIADEFFQEHLI